MLIMELFRTNAMHRYESWHAGRFVDDAYLNSLRKIRNANKLERVFSHVIVDFIFVGSNSSELCDNMKK